MMISIGFGFDSGRSGRRRRSRHRRRNSYSSVLAMPEMVGARERRADTRFLRDLPRERPERLQRMDEYVLVPLDPLEATVRQDQRFAAHDRAVAVVDGRRD